MWSVPFIIQYDAQNKCSRNAINCPSHVLCQKQKIWRFENGTDLSELAGRGNDASTADSELWEPSSHVWFLTELLTRLCVVLFQRQQYPCERTLIYSHSHILTPPRFSSFLLSWSPSRRDAQLRTGKGPALFYSTPFALAEEKKKKITIKSSILSSLNRQFWKQRIHYC